MKIDRKKNVMGDFYDYCLMEGNKELHIFFTTEYDLYMLLRTDRLLPENENISIDFDITKEDYNLYFIFDKLYRRITESNALSNDNQDFEPNHHKDLLDDNFNIIWVSDYEPMDSGDRLVISKEEDSYKLTFVRNDKPLDNGLKSNGCIPIRISNSGSRYNPFNCVFMELYDGLQSINPKYHQIRFEELGYNKELVKKR